MPLEEVEPDKGGVTSLRPTLINCSLSVLEAIVKGQGHLETILGLTVPDQWTEFGSKAFEYTRQKLLDGEKAEWWTYLIIDKGRGVLLGSCGFKGSPDRHGMVEIGYEVARDFRNLGIATSITEQLVDIAFQNRDVRYVQAHTLAQKNASVRVLEKNNFAFDLEIDIDGEGMVWRWRKYR